MALTVESTFRRIDQWEFAFVARFATEIVQVHGPEHCATEIQFIDQRSLSKRNPINLRSAVRRVSSVLL